VNKPVVAVKHGLRQVLPAAVAPSLEAMRPDSPHEPTVESVEKPADAGPLQDFYAALVEKGMPPSMARLTLARKIAAITLTIWKKGVSSTPNSCGDKQLEHLW